MEQKKEHKDIVMTCTSFYSIPLYYCTHLLCLVFDKSQYNLGNDELFPRNFSSKLHATH